MLITTSAAIFVHEFLSDRFCFLVVSLFYFIYTVNVWILSCHGFQTNEGVVSKETVVLRRWGSSIQKFGFINGVDNVNWPPYRDSKS